MPAKVSNPRDLVLLLAADLLFVERRLAGEVLPRVASQVEDAELRAALEEHLAETRTHVTRLETVFRRLEAAPSANLSRGFEGMVGQHDELAAAVVRPALADELHAASALRVEHYEIAGYRALLRTAGKRWSEAVEPLDESLDDEEQAAKRLERALERLAGAR